MAAHSKKGANRGPKKEKTGNSNDPNRVQKPGFRDKATIKRLNMYKSGGPKRDRTGKITKVAEYQSKAVSGERARVEPNRKWFGNTRTVTQQALQKFQSEMGKIEKNPYKVVMKSSKLPVTLLQESKKHSNVHILKTESFGATFGPNKHRKRPKIVSGSLSDMVNKIDKDTVKHEEKVENDNFSNQNNFEGEKIAPNDYIFAAGQSKRIYAELFKVIDCADVVIQVLDCRDPMGTRSAYIEKHLKEDKKHKHLIFCLNKCDLVPTWVTKAWIIQLSQEYPTLAFHASITKSFGKGALINLLRQFARVHSDKKQISVGFIGYPNVGKSSIINTLKGRKSCKVAPLAGETKVWQYISLFRRVNLIDCPGIVSNTSDSNSDMLCKGVVRLEMVTNPADYIEIIIRKVKPKYLTQAYKIEKWENGEDFLAQVCKKTGKLLKKGEPDLNAVAKMIFNDFQRGRLPYFNIPPNCTDNRESKEDDDKMPTEMELSFIDKVEATTGLEEVEEDFSKPPVTENEMETSITEIAATE